LDKVEDGCWSCGKSCDTYDKYMGHELCPDCFAAVMRKRALSLVDAEMQKEYEESLRAMMLTQKTLEAKVEAAQSEVTRLLAEIQKRDEILADPILYATNKWERFLDE
jgi:excinuclease UvrABC ATPase subunit